MVGRDLEIADGLAAGAWIGPRLGREFGAVTLQVPKDFEAYARVFHPASDSEGHPVSWADVAKACGTTPHREMQWHAILGLADADELQGAAKWAGSDPSMGAMDIETLDALCGILAGHTADLAHCFFGLCTIQNWKDSFSASELRPLLELPMSRDHIILAGPLSAVDQIENDWSKPGSLWMTLTAQSQAQLHKSDPPDFLRREAPTLIWPADRAWLVASELEFDSTLVGGTDGLIDAIVASPGLAA